MRGDVWESGGMPPTIGRGIVLSGRSSVRLLTPISRDATSLYLISGRFSMKRDTNIHNVSGHCWRGFQAQRSKVKVMYVKCVNANVGGIHPRTSLETQCRNLCIFGKLEITLPVTTFQLRPYGERKMYM